MDSCVIACLKHHCEKVILQYPVVMLPIPDRYSSLMILLINILARSRLRRRYLAYSHRQLPILEARQYSTLLCYSCTPSQPQQPGRSWGFHSVVRITPPQMRKWSAYLSIPSNSCKVQMRTRCSSDAHSRSLPMHFDQLTKTAANDTKAHEPHQRRIQTHDKSGMEDTAAEEGVRPCQMPT